MKRPVITSLVLAGSFLVGAATARADGDNGPGNGCRDLPSHSALRAALKAAEAQASGGLGLEMWGTVVDRDGFVCAVAFTGGNRGDQLPGTRVSSAQKANTANGFSVPGLALSTANLYTAAQPGGRLFGLQESNPVSTAVAYGGSPANYGQWNDPMVGQRIGGVNVFAGGLALYNASGRIVGGLGVGGDTPCADHNIAYGTRATLNLDYLPAGISGDPARRDNIVYDITPQPGQMPGLSARGWGHPHCISPAVETAIAAALPENK